MSDTQPKIEFDEKAADAEWDQKQHAYHTQSKSFLFKWGARWQFNQLRDQLASLKAENSKLKEALELWTQKNASLQSERDALKAENEINRTAAANGDRKLKEANERIVEFEAIKQAHLKVQADLKSELDEAKKRIAELESNGNPTVWAYEQATKALRLRHDEVKILRRELGSALMVVEQGMYVGSMSADDMSTLQNNCETCSTEIRQALADADALSKPETATKGEM